MTNPISLEQREENEIVEYCGKINLYDDDDFTPPSVVDDFEGEEHDQFWDWIQILLKASARNAIGLWIESPNRISSEQAWRKEALRQYPTPDAYEAVCKALDKHCKRADKAQEQLNQAVEVLKNVTKNLTKPTTKECECETCLNVKYIDDFLSSLSQGTEETQ